MRMIQERMMIDEGELERNEVHVGENEVTQMRTGIRKV